MRLVPVLAVLVAGCGAAREPVASYETPRAAPHAPQPATEPVVETVRPSEAPWQPLPAPPPGPAMKVAGAEPERCSIRVTSASVRVDGDVLARDAVVKVCKRRKAAVVEVEVGAEATWGELRVALEAARVPILMRGAPAQEECSSNPLAHGCM